MSCRCMKTTTQSGQAWRGNVRAQEVAFAIALDIYTVLFYYGITPREFGDVWIKWQH